MKIMKKIVFAMTLLLAAATTTTFAQSARNVLDKAASVINAKNGVEAAFKMSGGMGNVSGRISVKGTKFHATTPVATVWFDGKTQWTYLKKNDEVSVTTPTEAQLQAINPYNFINMYKDGYKSTMSKSATEFIVHLTANSAAKKVQELFITVNKKDYHPTQVKMLQGKKWTTFDISSLENKRLDDAIFTFNAKDFPSAEVIDLR